MFDGLFFFTYIFAAFVGCLAILLVVLLAKYWSSGNKQLLGTIRNFMICTALIDAIYFYMEYFFLRNGVPITSSVIRIADIFLFIGQVYFWSAYIRNKGHIVDDVDKCMRNISCWICGACLVLSFICYAFLMDDYYFTEPGLERNIAVAFEIITAVLLTSITIWHLIKGLSEMLQKKIRQLVTCISVLIMLNGTWNAVLVICLMVGKVTAQKAVMDPTSLMIFTINLLTIYLVYQEDFSALFHIEKHQEPEADNTESRLNFIAETHGLTQREREVLELAYSGMTNPEIADMLDISKYTVKRHMHNLFEKLDISTRMELVHLVNKENGPGGLL